MSFLDFGKQILNIGDTLNSVANTLSLIVSEIWDYILNFIIVPLLIILAVVGFFVANAIIIYVHYWAVKQIVLQVIRFGRFVMGQKFVQEKVISVFREEVNKRF